MMCKVIEKGMRGMRGMSGAGGVTGAGGVSVVKEPSSPEIGASVTPALLTPLFLTSLYTGALFLRMRALPAMLALSLCSLSDSALAAAALSAQDVGIRDVTQILLSSVSAVQVTIELYAEYVLWFFAGCLLVFSAIEQIFRKSADVQALLFVFVRIVLIVGVFEFAIRNAYSFSVDVMNSMVSVATGSLGASATVHFTDLFNRLFRMIELFADMLSGTNSLIFGLFLLAAYVSVGLIIVSIATAYVCAVFISVIGILTLGAGVLNLTRPVAFNYIKAVLAYGARLFALCFITTSCLTVIDRIFLYIQQELRAGNPVLLQDAGMVLLVLFFMNSLCFVLPKALSSLISK